MARARVASSPRSLRCLVIITFVPEPYHRPEGPRVEPRGPSLSKSLPIQQRVEEHPHCRTGLGPVVNVKPEQDNSTLAK